MDQNDYDSDFFEQPANQDIDDALDFEDSFQDQTTQTFLNDDLHINEETRKRINVDFKNKLEKFIPRLFSEDSYKQKEIIQIKLILEQIKISDSIILEEIQKEQKEEVDHQGRRKRIQERNTEQNITAKMKRHLVEGKKIDFTIHDKHYTPLVLSHNPCVIYITTKYPAKTLDLIHSLLRYIDEDSHVFDQNALKEIFGKNQNCKKIKLIIQQIQHNHLVVQLPEGLIKFDIKAGNQYQDLDIYKDQIMRIYCQINPELTKMCAFLNYWAYQRGILGEHALPEFALYCMIIDFFMIQTLVPNIFTDKYCLWDKEKKELKKQIQRTNDPRLKAFQKNQYIEQNIKKSGRKISKIFWITFPLEQDEQKIKELQQIWASEKEFQKKNVIQTNLGYQISVFFHIWNQKEKYQRPLSFFNDLEVQKEEIGLIIRNPFISNQNLTPLLVKRSKNAEFKSQNMYLEVRKEFQRAYDLILAGDIGKLCDKQQLLI